MNEKEKTDQILRISDIFIREYPTWENVIDTLELNSGAKENVGNTLLARLIRMGVMYPRYSDELQVDGSLVFGNVDELELMFEFRVKRLSRMMQNAVGPQKHINDLENTKMDILNKQSNVGWNTKPDNIENYL